MTLENLDYWARMKGITVLGTGDFTHPAWFKEITTKLEPAEPGLYKLKEEFVQETDNKVWKQAMMRFMLTVEISSIYSKNGKTRRIHNLIFAPSIKIVEEINKELGLRGNLASDGRPILGLDAKELAKIVFEIDENCMLVPAHAWTPWFSIFGSKSGFDSIEECFEEYTKYIYAIETGLSSDPAMNWRLSVLDNITLISNSDSHSLPKIGREANVFDTELSYNAIINTIKERNPKTFLYTVEFFPEEGKYHYDGHRACRVRFSPEETKAHRGICSRCTKPVTIGVMYRVSELADRPPDGKPEKVIPFKSVVPLQEIIAESFGVGVLSKRVQEEYRRVVENIGSEFAVLIDTEKSELAKITTPDIAEGIMRVRNGQIQIEPGYDGKYGSVSIFKEGEQQEIKSSQQGLL